MFTKKDTFKIHMQNLYTKYYKTALKVIEDLKN